jgi:hypothetical protein
MVDIIHVQQGITSNHWIQKIPQYIGIKILAWDRHKNVTGLNWLMGSQPSPSLKFYNSGTTKVEILKKHKDTKSNNIK